MDRRIRKSRKQEERVASRFGGTRNSGSGNGPWRKGDVRTPSEFWELKRTDSGQYTLKLKELLDWEKKAILDRRDFRFGLEMGGRNWVLMSEEDYLAMRGEVS